MNETDTWRKKYAILIVVSISIFTAVILLFLMISLGLLPVSGIEVSMLTSITIPTIISLYVIPKAFQNFLFPERKTAKINLKSEYVMLGIFLTFCVLFGVRYKKEFESTAMMFTVIFHYIVVSIGEEFTYRKLIQQILLQRYKAWIGIVLSATMFAFILHISENMMINLLIRFPMGVIFGFIVMKSKKIIYTVILHTIYNLVVLVI